MAGAHNAKGGRIGRFFGVCLSGGELVVTGDLVRAFELLGLWGALLGRGDKLFVLLVLKLADGSLNRLWSVMSDLILTDGPFFLRVDRLFHFNLLSGLLLFRDHVFFGTRSFLMHSGTTLFKDSGLRFPHIFFTAYHV